MPRYVSTPDIERRCRVRLDLKKDDNTTSEEFLLLIQDAYYEYWDLLIEHGPKDLLVQEFTFQTVAGQDDYYLPDTVPNADFYKLTGLYIIDSESRRYPLDPVLESELSLWKPNVTGSVNMLATYIPECPVLTAHSDLTADGAVGVRSYSGSEELIVQRVCADVRTKREEDTSRFEAGFARQLERLKRMANPDRFSNSFVLPEGPCRDVYRVPGPEGYRLRGEEMDLLNRVTY